MILIFAAGLSEWKKQTRKSKPEEAKQKKKQASNPVSAASVSRNLPTTVTWIWCLYVFVCYGVCIQIFAVFSFSFCMTDRLGILSRFMCPVQTCLLYRFRKCIYRFSFRSPSLIHPIFLKMIPKIQVRTPGRTKQTRRMPSHMDVPPPIAV